MNESSSWEIRSGGTAVLGSPVPYCGYPLGVLKDMAKAGYYLYHEGRKVKLAELTDGMIQKARRSYGKEKR